MMNRRSFLGSFFKAAVVAAVAPSILATVVAVEETWLIYKVDGFTIKYKHNPIFDIPRSIFDKDGFPLESCRMIFIDNDIYR